ncbi:ubiquitin-conjugating enzyme E2 J1-like isoform X2 [Dysidea avara]
MREAKELQAATSLYYAQPLEDNLFEWHFTVQGPKDTAFQGGRYHGRILLPPDYPMKPPSIIMLTPNGRFEVNKKICLSMSAYHPELWQPSWSIRTALLAIIGFMPSEGGGAIGSLDYTPEERKLLAKRSLEWVCSTCGAVVKDILVEDTDDEQSKKMTSEAADVALQMSFKSEEETKKSLEELKQKVSEMEGPKEETTDTVKEKDDEDKVVDLDRQQSETRSSSEGLRKRNVKETSQQDKPSPQSRTTETSNRQNSDGNNITSLLVLWALIFVVVMLALRRLLYM